MNNVLNFLAIYLNVFNIILICPYVLIVYSWEAMKWHLLLLFKDSARFYSLLFFLSLIITLYWDVFTMIGYEGFIFSIHMTTKWELLSEFTYEHLVDIITTKVLEHAIEQYQL